MYIFTKPVWFAGEESENTGFMPNVPEWMSRSERAEIGTERNLAHAGRRTSILARTRVKTCVGDNVESSAVAFRMTAKGLDLGLGFRAWICGFHTRRLHTRTREDRSTV